MQEAWELKMDRTESIESSVEKWRVNHTEEKAIRLDGDASGQPMRGVPLAAMQAAVAQLGCKGTYPNRSGVGGQLFLREAAAQVRTNKGAVIVADEVFAVAGRREAYRVLMALLPQGAQVLTVQPGDTLPARMALYAGHRVHMLTAVEEKGFLPQPDDTPEADIICLEAVSLATGAILDNELLTRWVLHASQTGAMLIVDTTYAAFLTDGVVNGLFGDDKARLCVAEVCGVQPMDGFSEAGCAFIVASREMGAGGAWHQNIYTELTYTDGVAYPVQRAVAAWLTAGQQGEWVVAWRENATIIERALKEADVTYYGGGTPFFWLRCPQGYEYSEQGFCDVLLEADGVACVMGTLFGEAGQGWIRISALGDKGAIELGIKRLCRYFM